MINNEIIENMKIKSMSKYACSYESAIRFHEETPDFRPSYYRDIDKILYTLSYIRYMDKTQVFTHQENDHLTRRMTHVQYVSKIARTIGRALNLNEDLIEASSLAHDLGHTPFGHVGEKILNDISLKHNLGYFNHNIHSVRLLMFIENFGKGKNLTLQVLDSVMCHNGEIEECEYHPKKKTKDEFLKEYNDSYKDMDVIKNMRPMTLEGCVLRISDIIAYIGKDIEDAVRLKLIKYEDISKNIVNVLGNNTSDIVNNIILDIIDNSYGKNYIKLSDKVFNCISELKKFNYQNIYYKAYTNDEKNKIEEMLNLVYERYLDDLKKENKESNIYKIYLNRMDISYRENNSDERIALDYVAGMTDKYLIKQYNNFIKKT